MIVAPNQKDLNDLVVEHNIEFKQLVDFENGDCDFDWEEVCKHPTPILAV